MDSPPYLGPPGGEPKWWPPPQGGPSRAGRRIPPNLEEGPAAKEGRGLGGRRPRATKTLTLAALTNPQAHGPL